MKIDILKKSLQWLIFLIVAWSCYVYGFVVKANGDNVEHLHSSWLIWQGYVPYKDFFQHHNPLLWYISAPFVALLINHIEIFSVFNLVSVLAVWLMAYCMGALLVQNGNRKISSIWLVACIVSSYSILWALNFRPDTFMYVCFFAGMLFLFKYLEKQQIWMLVTAYLNFFAAFMFTQKVLLNLIVPAGLVVYALGTRKIKIKDMLWASVLPLLLLAAYAAYLYYNNILHLYWQANFPFNTHIPDIFYKNRITFPPREYFEFYIFIPLGGIASVYFLLKGNMMEKVFSLIFVEETLLRMFYFSAFLHYSIFWLILGIMLTVMLLDKFPRVDKLWVILGAVYLATACAYNYNETYVKELPARNHQAGHEYAFYHLTPCDEAINGYYAVYNLKAKDAGYYWVLLGQIDVLGEKVGIRKRDNLNELIRARKPKIVSAGIYWDTYWEQRGTKIPAHHLDPYLLNTYYEYSGLGDIFILKPQYQKHKCRYNGKSWEYID